MPNTSSSIPQNLTCMNPGAAAIDIGSTMHMAAANPSCAEMPMRSFGTFPHDLHDLALHSDLAAVSLRRELTCSISLPPNRRSGINLGAHRIDGRSSRSLYRGSECIREYQGLK